jgi:hypothetical protein
MVAMLDTSLNSLTKRVGIQKVNIASLCRHLDKTTDSAPPELRKLLGCAYVMVDSAESMLAARGYGPPDYQITGRPSAVEFVFSAEELDRMERESRDVQSDG